MTATLAPPNTRLDWVTFSGEEPGELCQYGACHQQATHAGIFRTQPGCPHRRRAYCIAHHDLILRLAQFGSPVFKCRPCGPDAFSTSVLLWMERL